MIVKIWSISGDTAAGLKKGIADSIKYISDEEKSHGNAFENLEYNGVTDENITGSLMYIDNKDKIKNKFISGHLCDPDMATEQFMLTKERNLMRTGKSLEDDKGIAAFHIVQSFPLDVELSDEEIHQCGLELCEKLGLYQAVVATHLHAVTDKNGNVTGKQKHNHIIMNSHTMDPERQNGSITRMKYLDNKESYRQLQQYNDEIAIAHGQPIIEQKSMAKGKTKEEIAAIRKGISWKEKVRVDIDEVKKEAKDWDHFKEMLEDINYEIKEGKYITYKRMDMERGTRDRSLGQGYMKEDIIEYIRERDEIAKEIEIETERLAKEHNLNQKDKEKLKEKIKEKQERENIPHYTSKRTNTKTKKPYKIGVFDSHGRKRSTLEIILLEAMAVIDFESLRWTPKSMPQTEKDNPFYGKKDWKMQQVMDAIATSRQYGVNKLDQVKVKLDATGKEISMVKGNMRRKNKALNTMDFIKKAIEEYEKDPSDEALEVLKRMDNKEFKTLLSEEGRKDFLKRHGEALKEREKIEEQISDLSNQYKKLKKLEHTINLAADDRFCYGPTYEKDKEKEKEREETQERTDEKTQEKEKRDKSK